MSRLALLTLISLALLACDPAPVTPAADSGLDAPAVESDTGVPDPDAPAVDAPAADAPAPADAGSPCTPTGCGPRVYACGDCIDQDLDGLTDADDPDCLGPCDNSEDSYFAALPGSPPPPCVVDCYFDFNVSAGNDDCYWSHACDPQEVAPDYYPEGNACAYDPSTSIPGTALGCAELVAAQSTTCADTCGPLVPNGCDCFGCCELPAGSGSYVWLGSTDETTGAGTCDAASVADPTRCHPCTPVPSCLNPCDACEVCIGRTDLPASCTPADQCEAGVEACGLPGQAPCAAGSYCISGCCRPEPT